MTTQTRGPTATKPTKPAVKKDRTTPALFYRQVVAELRKVIWPTRKELGTYTSVVLVFVLIMVGIVAALDFMFGQAVLGAFSGSETGRPTGSPGPPASPGR